MTAHPPADTERALALGLAVAIERAMEPGAPAQAVRAARDAATILALDSLDVLLHEFEPHLGGAWPAELEPVRDRLLRTASRCREEGSLEPFRGAANEWAALSDELAAIEWTEMPALGQGVATLALPQALDDVAFETEDAAVHRVRLAAPVAASLRAALDWLAGSAGFLRPLRLRAEESLLEVSCEGLDPMGLEAAQRVIAAVDGSLGPSPRPGENGWTLRVPAVAARDHFLMLEQGRLRLAIPWHSVLRLHAVPAAELAARARALGYPLLEPLAPLATSPHERPVVTVAHGLRRGWVIADRVIWRLAAEPCAADPVAAASGLDQAVRTEEGEVFAVANARRLLGSTPIPDSALDSMRAATPISKVRVRVQVEEAAPAGAVVAIGQATAAVETVAPIAAAPEAIARSEPAATLERAWVEPLEDAAPEIVQPWWLEGSAMAARPSVEASSPEAPRSNAGPEAPLMSLEAADVTPLPKIESKAGGPHADEPAPATGTEFQPGPESGSEPPAEYETLALTALVVEDAFASQAFLARTLSDRGFDVVLADRARELDHLIESRAWSLVLLDVDLPDASGAAFLRSAIARLGHQSPPPPVIALVRDQHDVAVAIAAGLNEMLEKPVDERALVSLLERLAATRGLSA